MLTRTSVVCLTAAATIAAAPLAQASEGAASYYFAGGFGSFMVAVPPEPGFSVANQALMYGANASRAILNGRQTFGLQAFALYNFVGASYTFEQPVLGGRLQVSGAVPFLSYANMGISLQTQRFGTFSGGASDVGIGDSLFNRSRSTGTSATSTSS